MFYTLSMLLSVDFYVIYVSAYSMLHFKWIPTMQLYCIYFRVKAILAAEVVKQINVSYLYVAHDIYHWSFQLGSES